MHFTFDVSRNAGLADTISLRRNDGSLRRLVPVRAEHCCHLFRLPAPPRRLAGSFEPVDAAAEAKPIDRTVQCTLSRSSRGALSSEHSIAS
ncbi:hypothetical protein ABIE89_005724 [Bradyrhizobium niftali]